MHLAEWLLLSAAAVTAALAWWLWRRMQPPAAAELERQRRLHLHRIGRVTGGEIVNLLPDGGHEPDAVVFQYQVGGVTYQVSQAMGFGGLAFRPADWTPGAQVQVKYDPANPGNSIVACEDWPGVIISARSQPPQRP